jgi:peptidyl-prolyl cis-trans isomerase B (cyclophilin B)
VGTDKRERQKANRELRRVSEERRQKAQATKKRVLRVAVIVVAALAGVVGIAWVGGAFDSETASAPTTTVANTGNDSGNDTATTAVDRPETAPTPCPPADGSASVRQDFTSAPPMCIDPDRTYTAEVTTNFGDLTIALDAARAPETVNNFVVLARYRYFDDTVCHRIIPDFVVQCGDPTATGTGGPGYRFADELPAAGEYKIGSLAMANSGPDTNGSQFFIISGPNGAALPPAYSLFGEVIEGLETTVADMDAVGNPDGGVPPLEEVRIARVRIIES